MCIRDRTNVMEWTMPAIGVLPPFLILAAVLAIAPVAGIPPNKADAIFPAPVSYTHLILSTFFN